MSAEMYEIIPTLRNNVPAMNEPALILFRDMMALQKATNDRLAALEKEVRMLRKVTPAQVTELNAAIRNRAGDVCRLHSAAGCETAAANAIRKSVKILCGVSAIREIPCADYRVARMQIDMWDDYDVMMKLKRRAKND